MKSNSVLRPVWGIAIFLFFGGGIAQSAPPEHIAERALASTVVLTMKDNHGKDAALGSGFIVQPGVVVTNFHVVDGCVAGQARLITTKKASDVIGFRAVDLDSDIAILQIQDTSAPALPLGDSDTCRVGQKIFVTGAPEGLSGTFSDGVLSSVRGEGRDKLLQVTAPISHGSSGGPVLDENISVIGVATASIETGQNLNFAVPSSNVKELLQRLGTTASPLSALPKRKGVDPSGGSLVPANIAGMRLRFADLHGQYVVTFFANGTYAFTYMHQSETDAGVRRGVWKWHVMSRRHAVLELGRDEIYKLTFDRPLEASGFTDGDFRPYYFTFEKL